jgi:hypothetical protein
VYLIVRGHKMAKTAVITIELVPETKGIENTDLKKEIMKSLESDWLSKVLKVEIVEADRPGQK